MFTHILEAIEGIGIYQTISLVIFVPLFICVLVYVAWMKKDDADRMSRLPLN